jgi:pimeloyl-ACP methyl ester carboxylesterase
MLQDARGHIDYNDEGCGPTIVLVPGSWGAASAWRGVIAALGDGFHAVTTSLLGYGRTQERRTATETSIDPQAEIIEAVARRTGDRIHLVGHSFGGLVCLAVALRGAVPLASLTVIEAVAFPLLRQAGDTLLYQKFMAMRSDYFRAFETGNKEAARMVIDFFSGTGTLDALPQRMRDHIVATTPTHYLDMQSGFDPTPAAYAAISLPTLIIRGERTHPASARIAEILSRAVPGASLATIEGASHFMMATHPGEVARLVANHVSKTEVAL